MQPAAEGMSVTFNTEARCGWTLITSLALHAIVLFAVQVVPKGADTPAQLPLQVRIENMQESVPAQETPPETPAPAKIEPLAELPPPPPEEPRPETREEPSRPAAAQPEPSKLLPQIEAPMVEDPTYYPARQLDVHPTALASIVPAYPDRAANAGVGGNLTLLLLIDEGGVVREVSVAEANPEGWFEESAAEAFRGARFTPAQRKGRAVKSRVLIRVTYELNSAPSLGNPVRR